MDGRGTRIYSRKATRLRSGFRAYKAWEVLPGSLSRRAEPRHVPCQLASATADVVALNPGPKQTNPKPDVDK